MLSWTLERYKSALTIESKRGNAMEFETIMENAFANLTVQECRMLELFADSL